MFELVVFYLTVGCLISITRNYAAAFTHMKPRILMMFILWLFIVVLWPAWLIAEMFEDWN